MNSEQTTCLTCLSPLFIVFFVWVAIKFFSKMKAKDSYQQPVKTAFPPVIPKTPQELAEFAASVNAERAAQAKKYRETAEKERVRTWPERRARFISQTDVAINTAASAGSTEVRVSIFFNEEERAEVIRYYRDKGFSIGPSEFYPAREGDGFGHSGTEAFYTQFISWGDK